MAQTKVTKPGITDDAVTTAKILDLNVNNAIKISAKLKSEYKKVSVKK